MRKLWLIVGLIMFIVGSSAPAAMARPVPPPGQVHQICNYSCDTDGWYIDNGTTGTFATVSGESPYMGAFTPIDESGGAYEWQNSNTGKCLLYSATSGEVGPGTCGTTYHASLLWTYNGTTMVNGDSGECMYAAPGGTVYGNGGCGNELGLNSWQTPLPTFSALFRGPRTRYTLAA
jgi:hypothetical protein